MGWKNVRCTKDDAERQAKEAGRGIWDGKIVDVQWVMKMGSAEIGKGQIEAYADETVTKDGIHKFLDVAARFPQMPWYNILLILKQMPEAGILCGIRAWKRYGAVLRQGEKPVMLLSPVAVRGGDAGSGVHGGFGSEVSGSGSDNRTFGNGNADGNRSGIELGMESVGVYDIAQVKLPVNVPMLKMPQLDVSLEDALRERCGLVIMEDRDGSFLRSRAVKSCVSREERTIYIRPGLSGGVRNVELMKCYARYVAGKSVENAEKKGNPGDTGNQMDSENAEDSVRNKDAAVQGIIGEYRDLAGDYLAYVLCKYFCLSEYPLRVVPSELFGETAERKGRFLRELSALIFGSVKELTGKKMLGFNETMFCNLFFTEPDRERILKNLERFTVSGKSADRLIGCDLLEFQRDIGSGEKFSDGEIRGIYEKRLARELFTFPPVMYGE